MLSIIIPSVGEKTLQKTVDDIRVKARGDIEIIVVFDGTEGFDVNGAKTFINGAWIGMRDTINRGVKESKGEYIMKTDEHCMFGEGFDLELLKYVEGRTVVTPRRLWLDIDKWEIMDAKRYPADYERLLISQPDKIGGCRWDSRTKARMHIPVDETMVFQGSCYVMTREHWDWLGGLNPHGYGQFAQEAVEICLKTWLGGGKVLVNKNTWYAHKHRSFGRYSKLTSKHVIDGNLYSRDYWLNNRWEGRVHDLEWLMKHFGL